jgi:hypothetical protein
MLSASKEVEDPKSQYIEIASQLLRGSEKKVDSEEERSLSVLNKFEKNQEALSEIIKEIYRKSDSELAVHSALKLIERIVKRYPILKINPELFGIFLKAHEAQSKTIPDIKYSTIVTEESVCTAYGSDKEVFEGLSRRLNKSLDSENIYRIATFIRRVFDNPSFEQEILWDFIMEMCEKVDSFEGEEKKWKFEEIQATLHKIDLTVWNYKFGSFQKKVLGSNSIKDLLEIFCEEVKAKGHQEDGIGFLERLQAIYDSEKIKETLEYLKNH